MGQREDLGRVHEGDGTLSWGVEGGEQVDKGCDSRNSGSAVGDVWLDEVAETSSWEGG
jgi:hypothetical protein